MQIASDKLHSGLKLIAIVTAAVLATGCVSAKSKPTEPAAAAEPAAAVEPAAAAVEPAEVVADELTSWTVVEGNNLWAIACKEEVYNVPEKWPLIYKANLDQIEDADLIYAGQVLAIPRDSSQSQIDAAINHAKTRGSWAVGPIEASDIAYRENSG
jgi:nucleoid-associated protein YgaU